MSKIRRVYFFDKYSTKQMVSFLNNSNSDSYINSIMFNPLLPLHYLLPLRCKFLPESFLFKDKKNIKGLVTVAPAKSMKNRVEIQKLFFEENSYLDATELVQYVVSKYKALGALSVIIKVDDYLPELLTALVTKCNFCQISYEKLWKIDNLIREDYDKKNYRTFRNSDSQAIACLHNDILLPHFRPLLGQSPADFTENIFAGLLYYTEYKYTVTDKNTDTVIGYISITTTDNKNYILDIIQSQTAVININSMISFAYDKIKKRNSDFNLFVRTKRYTKLGETYENIFKENKYECAQNQIVLTNSSAKIIKETVPSGKYTVLSNFCPTGAIGT